MTHEIDITLDRIQERSARDFSSTRHRRSVDVRSRKDHVIDVVFLLFDRDNLDSRWEDSTRKHYAFRDRKLFREWDYEQTNIISRSRKKYVVVVTSAKRQRSADNEQSNEQCVRCFKRSLKHSSVSEDNVKHAITDIFSVSDYFEITRTITQQQKDDRKQTERRRIMTTQITFAILQYNVRNDKEDTMMSLLIDSRTKKYDLLTIQKSWRNVCVSTSYNSFNIDFHLLYENTKNVRTCFYVNTRLHIDHWSICYVSDDVCIIRIKMTNNRWINVHNVYSVSLSSYTTRSVLVVIETVKDCLNDDEKHILLENFNLHHSLWSDATRSTQHDATNQFLDVVQQTQFRLALSSRTVIWETRHSQSTIDLVFMTKKLQEEFIHCMTRSNMNQSSDHISIFIKLMIVVERNESRRRRAWKSMSVDKLVSSWREFVASQSFNCSAQIEDYALKIQQCVLSAIESFVSWANLFSEIKLYWNEKCADAVATARRRRREWTILHIEEAWRNYLKASNEKKRIIARKKKIEFRQVFRTICDSSTNLWRLARWARTRSHKSKDTSKIFDFSRRNIENNVLEITTDFEFKTRFLSDLFFSDTIEIDLSDLSNFSYLNVVVKSSFLIMKNEIRQAIRRCKSNSASEFDDILNRILKTLIDKLMSHLVSLFRACAALNYHPRCFREAHTIALKKLEKKNYTNVKTYRPIVLLNTLEKVLKSVIARRISDLTKTYDLLPASQMSERKSRSCETVLKLLTKQIHTIWNMSKDKIATLLSMNVVEAYDHVSRERLLHNLKKRRISAWIVAWADSFMQDRRISLIVSARQTSMSNVNVDISQKSSVSSILYLFYNANLLKLLEQSSRKVIVIEFVDDINILIYDISTISNCRLLEKMHEHCLLWSRRHEAAFASTKYELIHLTRNITKFDMQTTIKICDVVKQLFNHVRVLRMQIDNKLKWNAHLRSVQKKMITQTLTLSRLIAFTWRTCFSRVRLIYTTVIRSTIIYDSIIWHASHERSNSVVVTTKKLVKLQQQSLRLICDNFKTVSMQILEAETHVQLIQLHMIRLQMFFRQRMKKHRHDELIESFCRQIKHRLSETRERRRRKARKTSIERKIRWTQVMHAKLSADERENVVFSNRTLIKLFLRKWKNMWSAYQTKNRRRVCETLLKDITSKRMKLHKDLSKSKSFFAIHMRTKRIELADYLFFRRVLIVLTSDCLCGHSRQTLRHILLFCREWSEDRQRMLRDDETTDMSRLLNTAKDLKASIIWLMRINLLTQFSLTREYLD